MAKTKTKQFEHRLLELARKQQYREAKSLIYLYLKHNELTDEILLSQAFILYHHAAKLMYSKTSFSKQKKKWIRTQFEEAIAICKKLIEKKYSSDSHIYLNSRLYLAQIYAMLRKKKEAKLLARQTYKTYPSALTAERLADIYYRLGETRNAILWYKIAVKKTRDFGIKLLSQTNLAVVYKHIRKEQDAIKAATKAFEFLQRAKKNENSKMLSKILYTYFPERKSSD